MDFETPMRAIAEFAHANAAWAVPIVFVVAFCECIALLSFLIPATIFFTVFGTMAGAGGLDLFPLGLAASAGAGAGFWVSYWFGLLVGPRAGEYWPLRKNPHMLKVGHDFFEKWGTIGIFLGHFIGPVRAVIALTAGIVQMPPLPFHIANWLGAVAWGFGLIYGSGSFGQLLMR